MTNGRSWRKKNKRKRSSKKVIQQRLKVKRPPRKKIDTLTLLVLYSIDNMRHAVIL